MDVFVFHNQSSLFILCGCQFVICIYYLDSDAVLSCILDQMRATKECSWTDEEDNEDVDDKDHNDVDGEDTELLSVW